MLDEQTLEKLRALRLNAMATAWDEQQRNPDTTSLSFNERFGLLVDAEWMARENKRVSRSLKEAKLRIGQACIEGIDFPLRRELDKAIVRQLATCPLAQQACRKGYRALYRRASRLLEELRLARLDGSYARLLAKLARLDVLVIDDFALAPITDAERSDLLELLEDRHQLRSTILTSQLPLADWHAYLGDPTLADAICDRVLHHAHRLVLRGPSRRKENINPTEST
jgi:DNA replication protein DnaC